MNVMAELIEGPRILSVTERESSTSNRRTGLCRRKAQPTTRSDKKLVSIRLPQLIKQRDTDIELAFSHQQNGFEGLLLVCGTKFPAIQKKPKAGEANI